MKQKNVNKRKLLRKLPLISKILAGITAASYIWATVAVAGMQILPARYFWIIIAITAPFIAVITVLLWRTKLPLRTVRYSITIVLALLTIGISTYAIAASYSTVSFLDKIQADNAQYEEYSIIALKTHGTNLSAIEGRPMAQLGTDVNRDAVRTEVDKRVKVDLQEVSDPASLAAAIETYKVDSGVLKSSYLSVFSDSGSDFSSKVHVLATFRIKVATKPAQTADVTKPFVLYISGIDTYGDIGTVSRSDVNILIAVNPKTHKIVLVNTPRDYYVQLHGTTGTRDKLTHAGIYGVDMSMSTLEDLYGVPINNYARVNFSSLVKLIDAVGGVNVYSDQAFKSFEQGYNQLDGKRALEFSRERYSFSKGDRTRGQNQQRVIEALIAKMSDPKNIVNYQAILAGLSNALQTNMSRESIATLANQQLDSLVKWNVESVAADGSGATKPTHSMGKLPLYVMEPDVKTVNKIKAKLQALLATQ